MKKQKIVLSTLSTEGQFVNWTTQKHFTPKTVKYMPLGILSLASNIPDGHEIVILDPASEGWGIEETIQKIEAEKPDILGLSALTRRVYALNEILKKTSASYKVVGGPHATYYADEILQKGADAVFVGQLADKEFAEAVETKPLGIINCKTDINEINFPRRHFLDIESYFVRGEDATVFESNKRLPIFSSVGCPRKCNYCNVQLRDKTRYKNPKTILDEMEYLYSIDARSVHFFDDNFNSNSKNLKETLDEMEKRNFYVEWSGRGQVIMDLSLVERMVGNGFKRIHSGIEALDDKLLKFWEKGQTVRQVEEFCKVMNKNNVEILGFFILGSPYPHETEEYRRILPQKIRDLGINYPYFSILFPEPDTGYYRSLLRDGIYKEDHWAKFMKNPIRDFEIPYPYSEQKRKEVIDYTNRIIEDFKKTNYKHREELKNLKK